MMEGLLFGPSSALKFPPVPTKLKLASRSTSRVLQIEKLAIPLESQVVRSTSSRAMLQTPLILGCVVYFHPLNVGICSLPGGIRTLSTASSTRQAGTVLERNPALR
eukprot:TRINITY_DN400_c0_g1_i14.p4 TRINITY_DN400_c0_g1~~TRINITY_DN400_c0_g1_i14.p4  ORF type:complete len:106 (-),score=3.56 TRINITY_DN400_c0_g1_i14:553-870(-)